MAEFGEKDVEILEDRLGWDGFFKLRAITLRHRLFRGGWSRPINRELMERGRAVGVLPYDPRRDSVLLVEQFRVGTLERPKGPWLKELVAGLIDTDESPQQVARREAEEEAGITLIELEKVGQYYCSPGGSDEYFILYCGRCDLDNAGGLFGLEGEGEDIRAQVLSLDDAQALLAAGEIDNAHTIIALQWLALNRERLRNQWAAL